MKEKHICCLCGNEFIGFGNNPEPLMENSDENRCCDECNESKVIPERLVTWNKEEKEA